MVVPGISDSDHLTLLQLPPPYAPNIIKTFKMVLNILVERLSSSFIWLPVLFAIVSLVYSRVTAHNTTPKNLPWIGKEPGKLFAETRAHFSSFSNVRQWLNEGYEKVTCSLYCFL
jgi:hypothetical protein